MYSESSLTDANDALGLLQLPELKELHKLFKLAPVRSGGKAAILESFFKHSREHRPLFGQGRFMESVLRKYVTDNNHNLLINRLY